MKHLWRFRLTLFCIAAIWYLCLATPPSLEVGGVVGFDKLVHVVMYLGLCTCFWWEYFTAHCRLPRAVQVIVAVVLPVLMSGCIELVQAYCTETRSGDWADFAANSSGVLLALPVGRCLRKYFSSLNS